MESTANLTTLKITFFSVLHMICILHSKNSRLVPIIKMAKQYVIMLNLRGSPHMVTYVYVRRDIHWNNKLINVFHVLKIVLIVLVPNVYNVLQNSIKYH